MNNYPYYSDKGTEVKIKQLDLGKQPYKLLLQDSKPKMTKRLSFFPPLSCELTFRLPQSITIQLYFFKQWSEALFK